MCTPSSQLRFCTCLTQKDITLIELRKSLKQFQQKQLENTKAPFSWTLDAYKGSTEAHPGAAGMVYIPSHKIGGSLTEELVLQELNNNTCFDFDYTPSEGDNLQIQFQRNQYWTEFLSFVYRNKCWEADSYDPFLNETEPKGFGVLKVLKKIDIGQR